MTERQRLVMWLVVSGVVMTMALEILRRRTQHFDTIDRTSMHIGLVEWHSALQVFSILIVDGGGGSGGGAIRGLDRDLGGVLSLAVGYGIVTATHVAVQVAGVDGVAGLLAKCLVPVITGIVAAPTRLRLRQWAAVALLVGTTAHACYGAAVATGDTTRTSVLQVVSVAAAVALVLLQRQHRNTLRPAAMTFVMHSGACISGIALVAIFDVDGQWVTKLSWADAAWAQGYTMAQFVCSRCIQRLASSHDATTVHFAQSVRKSLAAVALLVLARQSDTWLTSLAHCLVALLALALYEH